jgi:predicted DNA-binding transcriptional regulator YafY
VSRARRLLDLVQILRAHRFAVTGARLADELGISLRTLYRDIAVLQAQGACIDGAPGVGYVLRPGFVLPPLMFTLEEVEALVLGSRWVADRGDTRLSAGAASALVKISAVLPPELRGLPETSALLVGPTPEAEGEGADVSEIRRAIRAECKATIAYRAAADTESTRTIWPFALGYFDRVRVLVAWCELRQGFRHFRTDRISCWTTVADRYPRRRQALIEEWRAIEGMGKPKGLTAGKLEQASRTDQGPGRF